jgi:GTP-binding protein EngB required for normal cell division
MMSEDFTNENQVVHMLDQQQFKLKDMKKIRADETMTSTINEINTSMIDVASKVDKLKKCI